MNYEYKRLILIFECSQTNDMKKLLLLIVLAAIAAPSSAQSAYTPSPENLGTRQWFQDARFGMFIHWGISTYLCNGEWVMNSQKITKENYRKLLDFWYPYKFDAAAWVSAAKSAGMKYITFTSRHHDSFSNWDTKENGDWKITSSRLKRDVLKELAEECRKQDIKLVLYYSTLDWYRDDYQWETGRTGKYSGRTAKSDWSSYINFMKAQLTELLTSYGPIAGIWLDGHWDQTADENRTDTTAAVDWHYDEIYDLIHRLQPACLIGNNHHLPPYPGEDFQMFERDLPGENAAGYSGQAISKLPLETCQTISNSWGYRITDTTYKSTKELVHLLVRAAGYGGNLLLNVGPMPTGEIQSEFLSRLAEVGDWTKKYGYTIYGTKGGFIQPQPWGAITQQDNTYYIHILNKESNELTLVFPQGQKIKSAEWLNATQPLQWKQDKKTGSATFYLNGQLDKTDAIIEVEVR